MATGHRRWQAQFYPLLAVLMALSGSPVSALDESVTSADPATENTAPEDDQIMLLERLRDSAFKPIRSLVVEREMPLVGIHWGADIQWDTPLYKKPDDAEPTLREAKLTFYRSLGTRWSAKAQAIYNNEGQFEIGDSYLVYTGWKTASAKIGVFKPAYSLENMSKRRGLTFMERALPINALSNRRSIGMNVLKRTPSSIFDAGVYFYSPNEDGQQEKGQSVALRYVHAPLAPEGDFELGAFNWRGLWAGVSLAYRANADEDSTRFRSLPETGIVDDYYVDTGFISGSESITRLGFEANTVSGSFSWQAEILGTWVKRDDANDVFFPGGYIYASWFLTGETRNYNSASGEFRHVTPHAALRQGGWGAWEVAARASTVDLTDEDIIGGRQRNLSLGVNWYLTERWRLQANLIKVLDVNRPGSEYDGEDPFIAAFRVQWYLP